MRQTKLLFIGVIGFYLCAVLNAGAVEHLEVLGARPDFLLLFGLVLALFAKPSQAAWAGLASGLLYGWVTAVSLTLQAIGRAIVGFACAAIREVGFEIDLRWAFGMVAIGSVLVNTFVFFLAPPSDKISFVTATIGTGLYNGVLAIPLYATLRRLSGPEDD